MSDPAQSIRSPDGQWWWNGTAWQPIASLPPSASVAVAPPVAQTEAEWPAWLPRSPAAEAAVAEVERRADPSAAGVQTVASSAPVVIPGEATSSTWAQAQYQSSLAPAGTRPRLPIVAGIGVLGLVAVVVIFMMVSQSGLLNVPSASGPVASTPTPAGSAYEQADRFLNGPFNTAINEVLTAQGPMVANCTGANDNTQACTAAITSSDNAMKNAIAVIDRSPFPACIAAPVRKIRTDFDNMEHGLAQAHAGKNLPTIGAGLAVYALAGQPLGADVTALQAAENSGCPKAVAVPATAAAAATPVNTSPTVPAGWLVYRNATWKYSVAYPTAWFQPPTTNDSFHYFSNENVSQHGAISPAGFDLSVVSRTTCLSTGGENGPFEPVISSAKISVAGQTVTRYFDQFKPPPGTTGGWNVIADVQVGGTCVEFSSFSYSRSVSESLLPAFDQMLASVRSA